MGRRSCWIREKRSNLISFKDSKSSTVEVLSPSPDELFVKIQKDATFEVFDPRLYGQLLEEPAEENSGEDLFSENPAPAPVKKPADRKTAFMELYQKKSETAAEKRNPCMEQRLSRSLYGAQKYPPQGEDPA